MARSVTSRVYTDRLKDHFVFLSASLPRADREKYFRTARPFDITDATIAAVRAVFGASGKLVFGGHPTISPLVLSVANDFLADFPEAYKPFVHIYQTLYYEPVLPDETKELEGIGAGKIIWTPAVEGDRDESLFRMRTEMLGTKPVAGIFIGGMEGVYSHDDPICELALFKKHCEGKPIYPIGFPGAASKLLFDDLLSNTEAMAWQYKRISLEDLDKPGPFAFLMNQVVADIIDQL